MTIACTIAFVSKISWYPTLDFVRFFQKVFKFTHVSISEAHIHGH